ncbi:MAG TPA: lactate utilization protein B [Mycobacterium sp.]|uniref:lactate utilization protein B n=1 Tax=Mycobacterium sp. TaxID=1785 RepID=UPI002CB1C900|nr:lactate utilization protein B [Mycobacterium sp.]HME77518.1 lactate utilization protein B [Mycobacterium sp.]
MKPVDQARNALEFLEDEAHVRAFDTLIWGLRVRRDAAAREVPEWEELRTLASQIKEHTLSHLAHYLEMFEASAVRNGATVHWARDAHEHNQIVYDILNSRGAKHLVKSKSMLTEECEMRPFLERRGIQVTETDLGERIQQLDDQPPTHIVGPAFQKTPEQVAELFHRVYGSDPSNADPVYLAGVMREHTRPLFLSADAGMTGANFALAQTGAIVTVTNEGNAELSANIPKLRICSVGIEKIIPGPAELGVFVRLLTRSATGERITQYTSHFAKPRERGEMHIVLVDNGRSARLADERFRPSLKCIRCGACMNTCPVYRRSGGLSYGGTYMGPIGIITMPAADIRRYGELPFASTINGSCSNVCPVQINIHEQIYEWRSLMDDHGQFSTVKKAAMKVAGKLLSRPSAYRAATEGGALALKVLPHFALYSQLNAWGRHRDVPEPPKETFHQWYARTRGRDGAATSAADSTGSEEAGHVGA